MNDLVTGNLLRNYEKQLEDLNPSIIKNGTVTVDVSGEMESRNIDLILSVIQDKGYRVVGMIPAYNNALDQTSVNIHTIFDGGRTNA